MECSKCLQKCELMPKRRICRLCYNYQKKYSMFQHIIKIISNKRYECFSNYIDKLDNLQ